MTPRAETQRLPGGPVAPRAGAPGPLGAARGPWTRPVDPAWYGHALASGDEAAFRILIDQHATPVLRICYRILGSVEEAEDAAQETFVLAFRARATYRADGSPDAWIARIATREAWRRRSQRARRDATTMPLDDALLDAVPDAADPVRDALDSERGEAVRDAVAALPDPYREVVALRYFADLSPAAIASVTQRPEGTVRAQLSRGLSRLRLRLQGYRP